MTFQKKKKKLVADTKTDKRSREEEINIFNGTRISDFASKKLDVKKR